ncbi:MAG: GDSL-type esterase/lipase family protein [Xanthobacteraceae bacterium]|uniref:SGNH/GDSL hydrolase family protein n=1 Tax=Pseudolabrys sp. TaxID=1960880 RepID=UPI003D108EC4
MKSPAAKHASFLRTLALVLTVGALEFAGVLAVSGVFSTPADAQFFRERRVRQGGFFDQLFGGGRSVPYYETNRSAPSEAAPSAVRPPAAKKSDTTPTLTVTVFGDSMADWLAYGLEDAFEDSPEIGIVRKGKIGSGLLRYDARSDLDWWSVVRDTLAQEKTDYVVMMLGINDRQNIRESQIQKAAEKAAKEKEEKKDEKEQAASDPNDENAPGASNDDEEDQIAVPERRPKAMPRGVVEFRSERWEQVYGKRIDDTIAALKSRGVPVLWVGLPPIRGTKSTANVQYLNDLVRARAEKAGITYVDVWDGFVDEGGKYTTFGPDFEGQTRRLRSGDGVHFTKSGARKLAHYVERDLRRFMSNRALPVALPSGGGVVPDANLGPAERPLAGPVVPLTARRGGTEELAGGNTTRPVHSDATATRVLVKGEAIRPPRGRADDFTWPRQSTGTEQLSPTAAAARATTPPPAPAKPAATPAAKPAKPEAKPERSVSRAPAAEQPQQKPAQARPAAPHPSATHPAGQQAAPRPPAQVQAQQQRRPPPPRRNDGGLFGLGIFR